MATKIAAKPSADLKFQKPSVSCLAGFYNNNLLTSRVVSAHRKTIVSEQFSY